MSMCQTWCNIHAGHYVKYPWDIFFLPNCEVGICSMVGEVVSGK